MRSLFASLRGYRIGWLPGDLVAGLMLAAIAIPGQLATARLAGMPPQTGLYAFAAGSLAFAAFGANRFMSVGADSTIAPIFAGGLASIAAIDPRTMPSWPRCSQFWSASFSSPSACFGQVGSPHCCRSRSRRVSSPASRSTSSWASYRPCWDVSAEQGHVLVRLVHALGRIGEANPYTLALGAGVLIVTMGTARISSPGSGCPDRLGGGGPRRGPVSS